MNKKKEKYKIPVSKIIKMRNSLSLLNASEDEPDPYARQNDTDDY